MATTRATDPGNGDGAEISPSAKSRRENPRSAAIAAIERWDRDRMLPRLIPVGPEELADDSREGRLEILRRLASALRGERVRGRAGHWSYSLDRHVGLVQAQAAELRLLAAIGAPTKTPRGRFRTA